MNFHRQADHDPLAGTMAKNDGTRASSHPFSVARAIARALVAALLLARPTLARRACKELNLIRHHTANAHRQQDGFVQRRPRTRPSAHAPPGKFSARIDPTCRIRATNSAAISQALTRTARPARHARRPERTLRQILRGRKLLVGARPFARARSEGGTCQASFSRADLHTSRVTIVA